MEVRPPIPGEFEGPEEGNRLTCLLPPGSPLLTTGVATSPELPKPGVQPVPRFHEFDQRPEGVILGGGPFVAQIAVWFDEALDADRERKELEDVPCGPRIEPLVA